MKVIFNFGESSSMASVGILPPSTTFTPATVEIFNIRAGNMTAQGTIALKGMRFPEFDRNIVIEEHEFKTFSTPQEKRS